MIPIKLRITNYRVHIYEPQFGPIKNSITENNVISHIPSTPNHCSPHNPPFTYLCFIQ